MTHVNERECAGGIDGDHGMRDLSTCEDSGLVLPLTCEPSIVKEYECCWVRKSHRQTGLTVLALLLVAVIFPVFCDPNPATRVKMDEVFSIPEASQVCFPRHFWKVQHLWPSGEHFGVIWPSFPRQFHWFHRSPFALWHCIGSTTRTSTSPRWLPWAHPLSGLGSLEVHAWGPKQVSRAPVVGCAGAFLFRSTSARFLEICLCLFRSTFVHGWHWFVCRFFDKLVRVCPLVSLSESIALLGIVGEHRRHVVRLLLVWLCRPLSLASWFWPRHVCVYFPCDDRFADSLNFQFSKEKVGPRFGWRWHCLFKRWCHSLSLGCQEGLLHCLEKDLHRWPHCWWKSHSHGRHCVQRALSLCGSWF